jgi:2-oxoglutarate ferredoxin oxidoreductase subunit beta
MNDIKYDMEGIDIAWCPGCGNFGILKALKKALEELEVEPSELVMVSGIGQAAKIPHYFRTNFFNGLHGRALPPATAIKACNRSLTVIAESGDGDMYGEGGNHFIHTIRRNPDITNIVHDNMIYGLTKGQASPTSRIGMRTPVQRSGVILEPFNPLTVAIALDAGLVARAYIGDRDRTADILKEAILFPGYSLVDLLQPCVTFNKLNTYEWFRENTYYLEEDYDPSDRSAAFSKADEMEKLPLGILYKNSDKSPFEENAGIYETDDSPLFRREVDYGKLESLIGEYALK